MQNLALFLFPALMAFAAMSDLLTMTIANWLSVALVGLFVALAPLAGVPLETVGLHLLCGLAVLLVTFALFSFGWVGGGDAKLAAATAVWVGFGLVVDYGATASILGGALTLLVLAFRRVPLPGWALAQDWLRRLHDPRSGVPYGVALALAALLIYPDTAVWQALFRA